jgi:hypothetical protein
MSAEYLYDEESKTWSFRVPELHIIGGAKTKAEAEKLAAEAIEFAKEPVMEPMSGGRRRRLGLHRSGRIKRVWAKRRK